MRYLIGTALAAAIGGSATAAEPLPAPPPTPTYNWTGLYGGINGGGAWGQQDPFNIVTNRFDHDSINFSGGTVGGTAGLQLQIGHAVLGFEADLDWAGIRGSSNIDPTIFGLPAPFTINASTSVNWDLTARTRVGYAFDNVLAYATFGVAVLGAKTDLKGIFGVNPCITVSVINGTPGTLRCDGTDKRLGATLGAGLEYGFTPNWSAKIEYRYTAAASLELSHINEVRAGVNYRFGGL
ncbi:MAG TPA: outer membrane beta-barrel protein [Methylocella sp.]|nr:outer membrane beta-barrel protein [Methylocella sp.]